MKIYYQGKKLQYIFSLSLLRVIKAISLYSMILRKQEGRKYCEGLLSDPTSILITQIIQAV